MDNKSPNSSTPASTPEDMSRLAEQYPWFSAARIAAAMQNGEPLPQHIRLRKSVRPMLGETPPLHYAAANSGIPEELPGTGCTEAQDNPEEGTEIKPEVEIISLTIIEEELPAPPSENGLGDGADANTAIPEDITPADGAPQSASGDIKNDTTAKSAGKKPAASKKKVILDPFDEEAIAKAEQEQLAARETDKGQAGSKPKAAGEDDGNDIIEKFIDQGEHKVVAKETTPEYIPGDNSGLPVDDDLITEELAEIYLDQELFGPAIAIYERLSLIYPKKSIYFAEIIESAKARAAEEKKK